MRKWLWILLVAAPVPALAAGTVAVVPGDPGEVKSLEEVIVTGERSLSAARMAIIAAEDRFYARWNSLNDDRRFDISCHEETPRDHHSRILRRVCEPAYIAQMTGQEGQQLMMAMQGGMSADGAVIAPPSGAPALVLQQELRKRTLEMLGKDPELLRALLERARLEQHYETLHKEKFKDRWIVWK